MTEQELHKLLEIQYLKGRLDELHKAFPTIIDLHRSRKLDMRLQKYYDKLKQTDEVAYHLYLVERHNQQMSKEKSQKHMKELLESVQTRKLNEAFDKYLPAVMEGGSAKPKAQAKETLTEGQVVTGDREVKQPQVGLDNILDIRKLAGLK